MRAGDVAVDHAVGSVFHLKAAAPIAFIESKELVPAKVRARRFAPYIRSKSLSMSLSIAIAGSSVSNEIAGASVGLIVAVVASGCRTSAEEVAGRQVSKTIVSSGTSSSRVYLVPGQIEL